MTLPASVKYGYIRARILLAVADGSDSNPYPDGKAPENATVTFTPTRPILATEPPQATLVLKQQIGCTIDSDGVLKDPMLADGVWLVIGQYTVSITTGVPGDPDDFLIDVTEAHTLASPLDLTLHMPPSDPTPTPHWQLLTSTEYDALNARAPETLYLIRRTAA